MSSDAIQSDMSVGLTVVFALLTALGALVMLAGPTQLSKAGGFALAMAAAGLAVVATQVYD